MSLPDLELPNDIDFKNSTEFTPVSVINKITILKYQPTIENKEDLNKEKKDNKKSKPKSRKGVKYV